MLVNKLSLPNSLVELLNSGKREFPSDAQVLAIGLEIKGLDFLSLNGIIAETDALVQLFEQGLGDIYGLMRSQEGEAANSDSNMLDVRLAVSIAVGYKEEGLCLDYRLNINEPRVLLSRWQPDTGKLRWQVIAPDFATFAAKLQ